MKKIWKNSENGQIVVSIDKPVDGKEYTDETNIANWLGMEKKMNMTVEDIRTNINSYISQISQLNDYDSSWLVYYQEVYSLS